MFVFSHLNIFKFPHMRKCQAEFDTDKEFLLSESDNDSDSCDDSLDLSDAVIVNESFILFRDFF